MRGSLSLSSDTTVFLPFDEQHEEEEAQEEEEEEAQEEGEQEADGEDDTDVEEAAFSLCERSRFNAPSTVGV